jgi:hypothetical protein
MAADPRLLLAARPTDVGAAFSNALLNVGRAQQLQQNRKQAELNEQLQPLRNRLLQAQTTTAEQGVQAPEQIAQARQLSRLNSVADFSQAALPGLLQGIESGDVSGTVSALQQRKAGLLQAASQGQQVDTTEVDDALAMAQSNPQGLAQVMQNAIDARATIQSQGRAPTTFQKGGSFQVQTPSGPAIATNIIDPTTGAQRIEITPLGEGVVPTSRIGETPAETSARKALETRQGAEVKADVELETEPQIAARVEQAETRAQKAEIREQASIDRGISAADSTANIRRAITLLDTVKTGGIDAVRVRAKQIFGIEGADEGELSSNLGKAVVAQLRETFGAAFTKSEGDKLDRIESGFGKSPAANRRLLDNTLRTMERLAQRGLKAAESRQDDFAIQSIQDSLVFDLGEQRPVREKPAVNAPTDASTQFQEGQTATNPQTGQKATFTNGQWVTQ